MFDAAVYLYLQRVNLDNETQKAKPLTLFNSFKHILFSFCIDNSKMQCFFS